MNPFSITVDYIEGQADGTIRVEVKTNNIILYQIPRNSAQNLTDRDELKKAGIYLLLNRERRNLYIGQADLRSNGEGVLNRMLESHSDPEIDSWQVAFVLTSSTPSFLGATELNYLEKFFYDEALRCGRYNLLNKIPPHSGEISPSTKMISLLSSCYGINSDARFLFLGDRFPVVELIEPQRARKTGCRKL